MSKPPKWPEYPKRCQFVPASDQRWEYEAYDNGIQMYFDWLNDQPHHIQNQDPHYSQFVSEYDSILKKREQQRKDELSKQRASRSAAHALRERQRNYGERLKEMAIFDQEFRDPGLKNLQKQTDELHAQYENELRIWKAEKKKQKLKAKLGKNENLTISTERKDKRKKTTKAKAKKKSKDKDKNKIITKISSSSKSNLVHRIAIKTKETTDEISIQNKNVRNKGKTREKGQMKKTLYDKSKTKTLGKGKNKKKKMKQKNVKNNEKSADIEKVKLATAMKMKLMAENVECKDGNKEQVKIKKMKIKKKKKKR
eukprot:410806_1